MNNLILIFLIGILFCGCTSKKEEPFDLKIVISKGDIDNGRTVEMWYNWEDTVLEGPWCEYDSLGAMVSIKNYSEDTLDGLSVYYGYSGNLLEVINHDKLVKVGKWYIFDEANTKLTISSYDNGKIIEEKRYILVEDTSVIGSTPH